MCAFIWQSLQIFPEYLIINHVLLEIWNGFQNIKITIFSRVFVVHAVLSRQGSGKLWAAELTRTATLRMLFELSNYSGTRTQMAEQVYLRYLSLGRVSRQLQSSHLTTCSPAGHSDWLVPGLSTVSCLTLLFWFKWLSGQSDWPVIRSLKVPSRCRLNTT